MRGEAGEDSLSLEFRSESGNRKLTLRLDIDGPTATGRRLRDGSTHR